MKRLVKAVLLFVFLSVPTSGLHSQSSGPADLIRLYGSASLFKSDGWILSDRFSEDLWSQGIAGKARIHFLGYFFGEVAVTHTWTQRHENVPSFSCSGYPPPVEKRGSVGVFSFGGGFTYPGDRWRPYVGFGKGWTEDRQKGNFYEFEGPTWAGFIGVERSLFSRAALVIEYRQYRISWENSFEDFPEHIDLANHQFDLGLSYAVR